ncbi:ribosome biogenesis protein NOP53 isoform X2 [Rhineura floridana]|uniref:ribosome biogenesis protein NOP53 isoform X2 n=1 Tax=Rhineura floridana TaxID=261503 RepID=UPI002AC840D9|nr:ribosome biogenesis protein NOP53 isoform X2 [Rhineura floridana]
MAPVTGSCLTLVRSTSCSRRKNWSTPPSLRLSWSKMASPASSQAASAESFLGFGPNSRDPGRLPSRRAGGLGARNRKKGWKRWRGPEAKLGRELGDWLEEKAAELRNLGGPVSEKPNESLFFVDVSSKEKGQNRKCGKEKPLKIDMILQPDSKVPPPKDILAHQVPNGRKLKRKQRLWEKLADKGVVPRKERLLQERLRKAPAVKGSSTEADSGTNPSRGFYDIWSDSNPLDEALAGKDTWFLEQTKKQPVKRPERLKKAPSQLPAVEVISPGGSYNPSFQAHQALLLQAHEMELKRQKAVERLERQLNFPTAAEAPTQETVFKEQCEGLLEEESDEEGRQESPLEPQEEEPQADSTPPPRFPQAAAGEKKTERQRKKEKEAKRLKTRELGKKAARLRRQELFQLRSLRLQVKQREAELLCRKRAREAKREAEANKPRRLGKLKYEDPDLDVQLSAELAESLRTLKPEGSILRDRFKSLQKRNLIEPRERAKFKRKYRLKYVEKRAFREITL